MSQCSQCGTDLALSEGHADVCKACVESLLSKLQLVGERGSQMVTMLQAATSEAKEAVEAREHLEAAVRRTELELASLRALLTASEDEEHKREAEIAALRASLKDAAKRSVSERDASEGVAAELRECLEQNTALVREGRDAVLREKKLAAAVKAAEEEARLLRADLLKARAEAASIAATSASLEVGPSQAARTRISAGAPGGDGRPGGSGVADARVAELEEHLARARERLRLADETTGNLKHAITKLLEEKAMWQEAVPVAGSPTASSASAPSLLDELNVSGDGVHIEGGASGVAAKPASDGSFTSGELRFAHVPRTRSYQFFVHLCCQAVKISLQLKHPDKAEAYAAISTKAFYYQALVESVPFHELFDWVKAVIMQEVVSNSPRPPRASAPVSSPVRPARKKSTFWDSLFSGKKAAPDVGNICGQLLLLDSGGVWVERFFLFNSAQKRLFWAANRAAATASDYLGALPTSAIHGVSPLEIADRKLAFLVACVDDSMSLQLAALDEPAYQAWIHLLAKFA